MAAKKSLAFEWIVGIYYIGSIIIPALAMLGVLLLVSVFLGVLGGALAGSFVEFLDSMGGQFFFILVFAALVWIGVKYTVQFLEHRYVMPNRTRVLLWSAVVLVAVDALITLIAFLGDRAIPDVVEIASSAATLAVFYFASRKYLLR